jgi:hypothetical protein
MLKSEAFGRPSVVIYDLDLVQSVDQNISHCFTILELSCEFPHISRTFLYEIITVRLGCHIFCTRQVSEMLNDALKAHRMASTLSELCHKDGEKSLKHIIRVTDDETLVSFMNIETKEQSKQ